MTWIVLEIQKDANNAVSTVTTNFDNEAEAESKFHQILMYASQTTLPCHTAMILYPNGVVLRSEAYGYDRNNMEG